MDIIETIKLLKDSGIDVTVHVELNVVLTGKSLKELTEVAQNSKFKRPEFLARMDEEGKHND